MCDAPSAVRGGCWLEDGTVVLAQFTEGPLWRVSESGGEPTPLTELDRAAGELSHRWPEAPPGTPSRGVLYVVKTSHMDSFDQADIWVHDLRSGTRKHLVTGGTMPRYVPETPESGLLIFSRDDHLWATRLDLPSLSLIGVPVEVWKDVPMQPDRGFAGFAIARETGTLLYLNAVRSIYQGEVVWVDSATGTATPLGAAPGAYSFTSIGPSGEIALGVLAANDYVSLIDDRGVTRRLSRGGNLGLSAWSSNADAVFCRDDKRRVVRIPVADPEQLAPVPGLDQFELVTSCSSDGRLMLLERTTKATGRDIWLFHADGSAPPEPLLVTPDDESGAVFSPDGTRIAYTQKQGGKFQVFIRGFPATGPDLQVSLGGGIGPNWSADGRELYFRHDNDVMAVAVPSDGSRPGPPRVLYSGPYLSTGSNYSRGVLDGRFLMVRSIKQPPTHIDMVLNWTAEVKRKLDASKR
jgi:dipeptidyl aminopeptidase/acylaminoacyl peptidase